MKNFSKLGLAAVLALGVSGAALAQDAGVGLDADVGVNADASTDIGNAGAGADLGIDTMATGSIKNHGNLVSSMQTTSDFDLSAYGADTTVNCVAVSTLQGNANGNAQAVGNAATGNDAIMSLHTDIQANADLLADLQASCQVAEFDVNDIVFVETGADGSLTFYYDDTAA